jgi:uncharacterized delta-60 repeat protein
MKSWDISIIGKGGDMFIKMKHLAFHAWLLGTLISFVTVTVALAAPGDLDTTFSSDGRVLTDSGGRFDRVYGIAIQPNGKIVSVGYSEGAGGIDFLVTRYNANGSLDTTFSGDGRSTGNFGGNDTAYDVAFQSNDKIVVVGTTCNASNMCNVAIARLNANGSADSTFSGDGRVVTDFAKADNSARAITIQPDNKIVLAGTVFNGTDDDFAIYRYNSNGSLDTTFSGDGRVRFGFGSGRAESASAMDIQDSDGKIVVVGSSSSSANGYDFALARLNPGGSLDATFSGDGRQLTSFGADDIAIGFAGLPDGRMVLVGQKIIWASSMSHFAIARYNPNGTLDTTFNVTGKKVFSIFPGFWSYAHDAFISTSGKIVVVGATDVGGNIFDFAVVRLNPGGGFDNTFSNDGKVTIDFGGDDLAYTLARQPSDGKYVLGGSSSVGPGGSDFALARVLP